MIQQPLGHRTLDDDGGGIVVDCPADHLAGIDRGAVHCAGEQLLEGDAAVPGIEEQGSKDLVRACAQAAAEVGPGRLGAAQRLAAAERGGQVALPQLQCANQQARSRRPQAVQPTQMV